MLKHEVQEKRGGKSSAYIYQNNGKELLDYILLNKKWINRCLKCVAYSSFTVSQKRHTKDTLRNKQ